MSRWPRWSVYALALANLVALLWLVRSHEGPGIEDPPPGAPSLELLPEPGVGPRSPAPGGADGATGRTWGRPETAAAGCWRVRLTERDAAQELAARAPEAGLVSSLRRISHRRVVGYWVYLPPAKDRETARETVRRLEAAGVRDVQLLGGARANAVSLGLFRSRELAEQRRARIATLGLDPVVEVRHRTYSRWEVTLRGGDHAMARSLVERVAPGAGLAACGPKAAAPGESR